MVSRHDDGDLARRVLRPFGIETIRGSGAGLSPIDLLRKGGTAAAASMLEALTAGFSVALTGDAPKIPRVASPGVVKLALLSGRPIIPVAAIPTRRRVLDRTWDKTLVPCVCSSVAFVIGEPIFVERDANSEVQELKRKQLEHELEDVNVRAGDLGSQYKKTESP